MKILQGGKPGAPWGTRDSQQHNTNHIFQTETEQFMSPETYFIYAAIL